MCDGQKHRRKLQPRGRRKPTAHIYSITQYAMCRVVLIGRRFDLKHFEATPFKCGITVHTYPLARAKTANNT